MAVTEVNKVIRLNVGGRKYDVSRQTLLSYPDSMLTRLISDKFSSTLVDGRFFIDRNGEIFSYILDYLRDRDSWQPPTDKDLLIRISQEARFYCLDPLVELTNLAEELAFWKKFPLVIIQICQNQVTKAKKWSISTVPENFLTEVTPELSKLNDRVEDGAGFLVLLTALMSSLRYRTVPTTVSNVLIFQAEYQFSGGFKRLNLTTVGKD